MINHNNVMATAIIAIVASGTASAAPLPSPVSDADFFNNGNPPVAKMELGKMLYWDKILAGKQNIACASCHHALAGSGDGLSLPIGEGGVGLGIARSNGTGDDAVDERVPRNAPPVYNLGAHEFTVMFHDGRLAVDETQPGGFFSPAGAQLPEGLDNALSAQAMFPVQSNAEMAGDNEPSNPQGQAAAAGNLAGPGGVWEIIADKLRAIPKYEELFVAAYDDIDEAGDITYVHAANAIGAYEATAFRADNSPFDRYLRGNRDAMSTDAKKGMALFYGKAGCAECHSGPFQTDLSFHAIAMPQVGPGKGHGFGDHDDFGRGPISGDPADDYRFRTPTLRNVELTGPWGHSGAYNSLRAVVEHHLDPEAGLYAYAAAVDAGGAEAVLPDVGASGAHDYDILLDATSVEATALASDLQPLNKPLSKRQVDYLMAFLHALTDENSLDVRALVPWQGVPSGLPLAD